MTGSLVYASYAQFSEASGIETDAELTQAIIEKMLARSSRKIDTHLRSTTDVTTNYDDSPDAIIHQATIDLTVNMVTNWMIYHNRAAEDDFPAPIVEFSDTIKEDLYMIKIGRSTGSYVDYTSKRSSDDVHT